MEYIKVSAKTVNDAIIEASIQLGTSSDNVEYEVLEEGSKGFLGIGSKPAVINARKKMEYSSDLEKEVKKEPVKKPEVKKPEPKKQEPKKQEPKKQEFKKQEPKKQEPKKPEVKKPEVVKEPKAPVNKEEAIANAKVFLEKTCKAMGMSVTIKAEFDEEENLSIDLAGEDMGILIGKRGQTLDSLQYLTSLVVNKGKSSYVRVKLDTENYRQRRKETLENLARNIASKVKRTRKTVFLEPMNPYERRIIHSALQNDRYVSTHSEGEEPYRKVVVTLKK